MTTEQPRQTMEGYSFRIAVTPGESVLPTLDRIRSLGEGAGFPYSVGFAVHTRGFCFRPNRAYWSVEALDSPYRAKTVLVDAFGTAEEIATFKSMLDARTVFRSISRSHNDGGPRFTDLGRDEFSLRP
jgi:hypothetical protein